MTFTPNDLAARWNCDAETVLALIHRGALRAFTLSPPGCKRPRWKISATTVVAYEAGEPIAAEAPVTRRQKPAAPVKRFFR